MSQTNAPVPATVPPPAGPVAAPRGPRERRVRTGHLLLAIALVVVGALGTVALVSTVSARGTYLVLAQDVAYGQLITDADLAEVRIARPPPLEPISAGQRSQVVGLYAAMPLAKGTTLTRAHLVAEPVPGEGERIIGLNLRRDQLPAQAPRPGDPITLVATTDESSGDQPAPRPRTFDATVTRVTGSDSGGLFGAGSGTVTIDVAVATTDAAEVAVLAADGDLTILLGGS